MAEWAGGCQCGAVRFTIRADRLPVYACHCLDCQKQSASAFALSAPAAAAALHVTGELAHWERGTHSGARTRCYFCPRCGSRLYHQSTASSDSVTLKAGALDDTPALTPIAHLWVSRKHPWVTLDPSAEIFETQPHDLPAWRATLMAGHRQFTRFHDV